MNRMIETNKNKKREQKKIKSWKIIVQKIIPTNSYDPI